MSAAKEEYGCEPTQTLDGPVVSTTTVPCEPPITALPDTGGDAMAIGVAGAVVLAAGWRLRKKIAWR